MSETFVVGKFSPPEQLVCFNLLQDQRKAIVEMYIFNMTILAKLVLEDVDAVEEFVNGARNGVLVYNSFMKGYISGVEEKFPHEYGPGQRCKFCGELRTHDD